jgi:hypothetical protein
MSAPAQQRDPRNPNFYVEGETAYDMGPFHIEMNWGHSVDNSQGIRPEEAVAWITVEAMSGHSEGLPLEPVRIQDIEAHDESHYLGKYRIISLVSTCFIDKRSLAIWFDSANAQNRLQEEHNKAVATSGTGESPHQPQTPSVGGTSATVASNPPSGTVQTAPQDERDDREDSDDDRRSVSTAGTDVQ